MDLLRLELRSLMSQTDYLRVKICRDEMSDEGKKGFDEFIDFIIDRLKDKYKKKYPGAKTNLPFGQARAWELVGALMREGLL